MSRTVLDNGLVLVDSITEIIAADAGRPLISGSHGGRSAAGFAAAQKAIIYVFNDAGIGKDRAGIAGLDDLQSCGQAACCVAANTARIGDAQDTLANGIVSASNESAIALGFTVGRDLRFCLAALDH